MAFQPGDLVQLKSGGPLMTVTKTEGKQLTCMWYVQDQGEYRTEAFEEAWLDEIDIEDDEEEDEE